MSQGITLKGACLCGAVTVTADPPAPGFGACHCGMCRKWSGGPLLALPCGPGVTLTGEDAVTVYDSSPWAERGFCSRCGTHLFYRVKHNQEYHVPVGLFDDTEGVSFALQVFIDKKPPHYAFADQTAEMTEAQIFEKYAPKED